MHESERIEAMIRDLEGRGIGRFSSAPPFYRFLWRIGIQVPPPYFQTPPMLFVTSATYFGLFWFLGMVSIRAILFGTMDLTQIAFGAVVGGLLFGALSTALVRYRTKRLHLPRWDQHRPNS